MLLKPVQNCVIASVATSTVIGIVLDANSASGAKMKTMEYVEMASRSSLFGVVAGLVLNKQGDKVIIGTGVFLGLCSFVGQIPWSTLGT